jgi:predicted enzyme related to lactoylglutathione lyase
LIELYADVPNISTSVYEEISDSRYYFVFTYGPSEINGEFQKVSANTINYFISTSDIPTVLTRE